LETLALAASVILGHVHGVKERDAAGIHEGDSRREAEIHRVPVDDRARAAYGDLQEATEEGAEAVALMVTRRVLNRIVVQRLPKGTGADYLMRVPEAALDDSYERLECSGIAEGQDSATSRLRSKLDQLARFPSQPPGRAVVTNFRMKPVEIRLGSLPR
jgi:hypothetical protein